MFFTRCSQAFSSLGDSALSESGESSVVGGVIARGGTGLLSIFRFAFAFRGAALELLEYSVWLVRGIVLSSFCRSAIALTTPAALPPTAFRCMAGLGLVLAGTVLPAADRDGPSESEFLPFGLLGTGGGARFVRAGEPGYSFMYDIVVGPPIEASVAGGACDRLDPGGAECGGGGGGFAVSTELSLWLKAACA